MPRPPFLICALPRSGTAWLANFLTHGRVHCEHELSAGGRSGAEMYVRMRRAAGLAGTDIQHWGVADTSLAMMLPEMLEIAPHARVAVIRRREREVSDSLRRLGFPHAEAVTRYVSKHVERACQVPGALVLDYEQLTCGETLAALLHHVAPGEPFNVARWQLLRRFQVQLTAEELSAYSEEGKRAADELLAQAIRSN